MKLPPTFEPTYEDFEKRGLGFFKVDDKPEKANFPLSTEKSIWNFEIIFDDYKCTAGKLVVPLKEGEKIDVPEKKNISAVNVYFIFSKIPVLKEKTPLRWGTYFFNWMAQKQVDSIERNLRSSRESIFEKVRQYKEFQRRKERS
ncbi:MAG: hypothetical protein IH950_13925 [Bacteroidetes bacterium]|nr:hypothetical protein [Bacteroidota bacterium]